jgi:hypothetical protein
MALLTPTVGGSPFSGNAYNANLTLIENTLTDLGPWVVGGLGLSMPGGLNVGVAAGTAVIGGRVTVGSFTIGGLADATINHLYLLQNGTGTSNTTGTQPALSAKLGRAVTAGGVVTSVDITTASGRQQKPDLTAAVPVYVVANSVPDRAFDAATVTTAELAQVVAAVIADLKTKLLFG